MFFKRKINYVPNIDTEILTNTKNPIVAYKSTEHGRQDGWLNT